MRTTKPNRLLLLLLLAAVVYFSMRHAPAAHTQIVYQQESSELQQSAGTQRLWESLSRQFVSVKAY